MGTLDRLRGSRPGSDKVVPGVESASLAARRVRWLRIVALVEATTLLVLVGVAVPLKHLGDWPLGVRLLGPIHGLVFVAYLWLVIQSRGAGLLSRGESVRLAAAAFVPVAGFVTARSVTLRVAERLDPGARR